MYKARAKRFKSDGDTHWAKAKNGEGDWHYGKAKEKYIEAQKNEQKAKDAKGKTW